MAVTTLPKRETRATRRPSGRRASTSPRPTGSRSCTGFRRGSSTTSPSPCREREIGTLQIPFGLHWSEVTASTFMEIGFDGTPPRGRGRDGALVLLHPRPHPSAGSGCGPACCTPHMPYTSALALARGPAHPSHRPDRGRGDDADRLRHGVHRPPPSDPKEGERLAEGDRRQDHPRHGQPRGADGGPDGGGSLRSPLLRRTRGPGAALPRCGPAGPCTSSPTRSSRRPSRSIGRVLATATGRPPSTTSTP